MSVQDDDFEARIKRFQVQSRRSAPMPSQRHAEDGDFDEKALAAAILRPQLALVLGAVALVAVRGIAMNYMMIEPSTDVLGWGEGAAVLLLLFVIGLLFGKSDILSHGALVVGACLAFLGENYYIPVMPDLMGWVYDPDYVALVIFNAQ